MIQSIDYYAVAPPLILALTAGLVLLLDVFLPRRPYVRTALGAVTLAGVIGALAVVISQAVRAGEPLRTFCVPEGLLGSPRAVIGAIVPPVAEPTASTAAVAPCSFVVDDFTLVFAGLALFAGIVVVLLSAAELSSGDIPVGEWYFLLLCTLAGAVALPASRDLIMLVVALELVSLPVFALTALRRYDGRSSEAAVKLFLVSVVSTAVMLFGVSLLYGTTGTVYLDRIAHVLRQDVPAATGLGPGQGGLGDGSAYESALRVGYDLPAVVTVAVVLVLAGFAFKIAAVPFHAWAGDVYQGAPVPIAALLSVISKAAGFAGLILILVVALGGQGATWVPLIAILAALTMTVGNLLAMRQRHAVRLLAWSSVAQSGYILAPLGVRNGEAMNASVAYLVFYAAMNLGAFAVVTLVSRRSGGGELDDYRGLAFRSPAAGLVLAFSLICLAGLPPGLAGLFAKIVVFRELLGGGGGWLAAVMAVNTVVGLYYYVAWVVRIFTPVPVTEGAAIGSATAGGAVTGSAVTGGLVTGSAATGGAVTGSVVTVGVETGSVGTGGRGAGWIPASVAVTVAAIVAIAFSVAPQLVFDLVPAALIAAR
ncbi:NADH-quinone oxidoreductase subunit N [Streptosporangium sp. NBC_01469]|uniref:NADH-quinone oxidoreductase subunit N n=1 Tax=Streptosporangium sp. NBC_01469 TaxID=2903898 RepID=UPI002E2C01A9|nr:NADH-quinone oxidoreductase subunit N [Streptosporangium sp. NBC_01469]